MRAIILAIGPLALYFYEGAIIPELNTRLDAANKSVSEAQQFIKSKKGLADEIKKYEDLKINYFEQNRKSLDANAVQNQGQTGTCWSFSSMSFFESELIRMGKGKDFN